MIQRHSVIMLGQSHKMMLDGGNKNADKEVYYCSDVDPAIAKLEAEKLELIQAQREQADKYLAMKDKLEAENKRLRELAYKIWVHQSWADNPRIEFDIWLEQALKEE